MFFLIYFLNKSDIRPSSSVEFSGKENDQDWSNVGSWAGLTADNVNNVNKAGS